ncbi:MAG TPA: hypothetical protein VHM65_01345 [Candidatus Lustribacter sp.]|nr:hypothetical protein [Candidatus Lustribacter sp.]
MDHPGPGEQRDTSSQGGVVLPNTRNGGRRYVARTFPRSLLVRQQAQPFVSRPNRVDVTTLKELVEAERVAPAGAAQGAAGRGPV